MLAAGRTGDVMLVDKVLHFSLSESVDCLRKLKVIFGCPVFDDFVRTESLFALLAVHKRVGEAAEMSGSYPCLRIHEDSCVKTYVIFILLDEFFPPCFFDVVFQLRAERTVVPCVGETAVDFASCVNKSSVFAESNYLIHCFCFICHASHNYTILLFGYILGLPDFYFL